jgi:hypothetical protein
MTLERLDDKGARFDASAVRWFATGSIIGALFALMFAFASALA